MLVYVPVSLWSMLTAKVAVPIAMISTLPLYVLAIQLAISIVGLYEFTAVHGLRPARWSGAHLVLAFMPYQWLLGYAAFRAVWRELRGINTWEKTAHTGAHRRPLDVGDAPPPVADAAQQHA